MTDYQIKLKYTTIHTHSKIYFIKDTKKEHLAAVKNMNRMW